MIVHKAHQSVHGGIAFIAFVQHVAQLMGTHGRICQLDEFLCANGLCHLGVVGVLDLFTAVTAVSVGAEAGGNAVTETQIGVIVGDSALRKYSRNACQHCYCHDHTQQLLPMKSFHVFLLYNNWVA